ncbi:MAG TPA: nuclease-related domain-containing protein [Methylomirabilota bacterium]|nr:nuclease-related domain-containing protein [Methylomirabilota bacterium]
MSRRDLVLYIASLVPFFAVFLFGITVQARNKRRKLLSEKVLRPPGHSLKQRLETWTEQFDTLGWTAMGIPLVTIISLEPLNLSWQAKALPLLAFSITLACIGLYVHAERRKLRLAIDGEVIVAEFLNELRAHGYRIYHDYPTDSGNIDHIIIGRGGVFAVETKARRKSKGGEGHKVTFEQGRMNFPTGSDTSMIPQAIRQAEWLAQHLAKGSTERVSVEAILALPGWWVELKEKPPILILNPKQISSTLAKRPALITDEQTKRIAFHIEERVRDVEV